MNPARPPRGLGRPVRAPLAALIVVLVAALAFDSPCRGQGCLQWVNVTPAPTGPEPRSEFGMVYDSGRSRAVLFGGRVNAYVDPFADTWEWNGERWFNVSTLGPTARYGHAMAYDAARGVTVLFGGRSPGQVSPETWEWNGTTWTRRSLVGPAPRSDAAMAYDGTRQRIVLFGGIDADSASLGDTWSWDGTAWTLLAQTGPSPRPGSAMAWDSARQSLILFGGWPLTGVSGETWEWNGTQWTVRGGPAPSARAFHTLVRRPTDGALRLFGGKTPTVNDLGDTWTWANGAWRQESSLDAAARNHHGAFCDAAGDLFVYGGTAGREGARPDVSAWDETRWSIRWGENPGRRTEHTMAFDTARNVVVMFGGGANAFQNDTWEWNGTAWRLRSLLGPRPRHAHMMAFDRARSVTVLFGGFTVAPNGSTTDTADTWEWDGSVWRERVTSPAPQARNRGAMVYDDARSVIMLHGGGASNTTWWWDGSIWSLRGSATAIRDSAMAFDSARAEAVLYECDIAPITRLWDGASWRQASVFPLPSARRGARMEYDHSRGRAVLFGGVLEAAPVGGTWEWDGARWSQLVLAEPAPRGYHGMAFDTKRQTHVIYGGKRDETGTSNQYFSDVWELRSSLAITQHPAPLSVQAGRRAEFTVAAASPTPITYRWRKDGQPLTNGGRITGADTDTLAIDPVQLADAGDYSVTVTSACGNATSSEAALAVTCYADCDTSTGPGVLDIFDFLCFQIEYHRGSPYACACDTSTGPLACDVFDFLCFQNAYSEGCP